MKNNEASNNFYLIVSIIGFFLLFPHFSSIFTSENEVVPHINGMYDDELSRRIHEADINHQRREMGYDPLYQDY